jgi:hypothetical protein
VPPWANALHAESGHHPHLHGGRVSGEEAGLWRISLEAVDG